MDGTTAISNYHSFQPSGPDDYCFVCGGGCDEPDHQQPAVQSLEWRIDPFASCDIIGTSEPSYLSERIATAYGDSKERRAERAGQIVRDHNERAELIAALRNLSSMTLLIMPPPYGHECGWCGGCVKRAKSEARALLDKVKQ